MLLKVKEENERSLQVDCSSLVSPSASSLSSNSSSEPPSLAINTHPTKSSVKRLLKRERVSVMAAATGSECLSSDEGYAGSFSESYLSEFRKSPRSLMKCAEVQEEPIHLGIFNGLTHETPKTLLDEITLREQRSLFETIEEQKTLAELERIGEETALERTVSEKAAEEEMRVGDWRRCLERRSAEEKSRLDRMHEDELDLGVYLQEIDMNVTYFQSEPTDPTDPCLLKFASAQNAFNLRLHHRLVNQRHNFRALFADVDAIPEFVPAPLQPDLEEDEYETTYVEEAYETEIVDGECVYPEQEYTMVEADEGFREAEALYLNDDIDCYDQDLDEFEDQLLIDSLTEEERLALLQSESEKYALQIAQASKYGILNAR